MRAINIIALACFSVCWLGCDSIPTGYIGGGLPVVRDPAFDNCTVDNYSHNDIGDGLNPDVLPASAPCGTVFPDAYAFVCSACAWSAVDYTSTVSGATVTAYPTALPPGGCWFPTDYSAAEICFNSCDEAAAAGCH